MTGPGQAKWTAVWGVAMAVGILLWPLDAPPGGAGWMALGASAHVLTSAGLAWVVGRALAPAHRGWLLWIGVAAFFAAMEVLQPFVGRSAEWTDGLYGAGGAACVCAGWHGRPGVRWTSVLALALFPPVWEAACWQMEARAFPILAQPGARWAGRRWTLNGVDLATSERGGIRLQPVEDAPPNVYPGLFRVPVRRDWRGVRSMEARVYWPQALPAVLALRVDDLPGNPPYAERVQKEVAVTQGWNVVRLSAEEIGRTPGGRPLRLDQIRQWGVFLVSGRPFDYFEVGIVRLDMQEDKP